MKTVARYARNILVGLIPGLLSAPATLADDTEIYVGLNAGQSVVKPNVMFEIDTTGSMY